MLLLDSYYVSDSASLYKGADSQKFAPTSREKFGEIKNECIFQGNNVELTGAT